MIKEAFRTGQIQEGIGETLISLISRRQSPTSFADFRPISLCNVVYKLITKIIASRLRPILCSYICPTQEAFFKGRGTSENAIILQNVVYRMKKRQV